MVIRNYSAPILEFDKSRMASQVAVSLIKVCFESMSSINLNQVRQNHVHCVVPYLLSVLTAISVHTSPIVFIDFDNMGISFANPLLYLVYS